MITIEQVHSNNTIKSVFVALHSQHGTFEPRRLELTSFKEGNVEVHERDEDGIYVFVTYITRMANPARERLFNAWKAGLRRMA